MTTPRSKDVDFTGALLDEARQAKTNAYAPYSGFHVGAALLASSGKVYRGCNVENASLGLTVCAERVAFQTAVAAGERVFTAVAVATDADRAVAPCGACRQVLAELGPDLLVVLPGPGGRPEAMPLAQLLPGAFGPADLARHRAGKAP